MKNMDFYILGILLILSLAFLFIGFFKKQVVIVIFAGIGLLFLGVATLYPLSYIAGYNEVSSFNYACGCCLNGTFTLDYNVTIEGYCYGTPHDCDYYDGDNLSCELAGCTYNESVMLCFGTPNPCEVYETERDCEQLNCTWDAQSTSNTCVNDTELIVANETKTLTPNLSTWDSSFKNPVAWFFVLTGLVLIFIGGFEVWASKNASTVDEAGEDDE